MLKVVKQVVNLSIVLLIYMRCSTSLPSLFQAVSISIRLCLHCIFQLNLFDISYISSTNKTQIIGADFPFLFPGQRTPSLSLPSLSLPSLFQPLLIPLPHLSGVRSYNPWKKCLILQNCRFVASDF